MTQRPFPRFAFIEGDFLYLCAFLLALAAPISAQQFEVTDLGVLPGDVRSEAKAINNNGIIVGHSINADGYTRAFRWQDGDMDIIPAGAGQSWANAINDANQVVGAAENAAGRKRAFMDDGMNTVIMSCPCDDPRTNLWATGINNGGRIIGNMDVCGGGNETEGFLWDHAGDPYPDNLEMSNWGWYREARAINDAGRIAGSANQTRTQLEAVYWESYDLHSVGSLGGDAFGNDINQASAIVGCSYNGARPAAMHAFRWQPGASLVDLGTLGGRWSSAAAINNNGSGDIAGLSEIAGQEVNHAFLIPATGPNAGRMLDLNSLIPPNSGWTLSWASDINDDGWITGVGVFNGQQRAFLLKPYTPPTPSPTPFIPKILFPYNSKNGEGVRSYYASATDSRRLVADEWRCPDGAPIQIVRWWGAYSNWGMDTGTEVAPPVAEHPAGFRLTWYEYNDFGLFPVPGKVIKQETINKVSEHWVNANPYWYDPQYYVHVYEYQVTLADPWNQIQNGRYFLSIEALYDSLPKMVQWGWMNTSEKTTPSAVAIDVADWYELVWPEGHPFFGSPMNMSFALTVPEPTPEPTPTPAPTRTLVPTPSISPVPTVSLTPSPSLTPAPTPCMMQVGILPAASGPWINERDLRRLIQLYVPDYQSMILAFTQCYGGAFTDSFTDFPRTSILSATMAESPWELSYYGGYHDDAARAVLPGPLRSSNDIHSAGIRGKNSREHPSQAGVPVSLESASPTGLIQGRNIVVYGGQPNNMDYADFSNISTNFLGQPNTMVLGLGGAPAAGWNFAATLENLSMTLSGHVRPRMDANRQFILFVTDHGGLSLTPCEVPATAVFSTRTLLFPLPLTLVYKMKESKDNDDGAGILILIPGGSSPKRGDFVLGVDKSSGGSREFVDFQVTPKDLDGDGFTTGELEGQALFFPVPEADLLPPDPQPAKAGAAALSSATSEEPQDPILHLRLINNSSNVIMVESVELISGPLEVADPATLPTETPSPTPSPTDVEPTQTDVQPTQTAKPTDVPTLTPTPTTEPTVTFGPTPTFGPPSQPKGRPVLHVELYQPSINPGGGKVFYTYKWTSDGGDNPVIHGPIEATEDLLREGEESATFNPGETWTVAVTPQNEQGEAGFSYSCSFFFTPEGTVVFQGWIIR